MSFPKISIVIVNYNLADYLEETIASVVNQGYPNLECIVIDGGSTDGSVEIIKKYESKLAYWVSESDNGQYHAVQKGFEKSTGEIMAWLNSDDKYYDKSLFAVGEIFSQFSHVKWIQGLPTEYTNNGIAITRITLQWARWSKLRYLTWDFQFIQQESTFWRRELWDAAGGTVSQELKLAGDLELWARFFRHAQLYTTMALLGGFRHRPTQRSKSQGDIYLAECQQVINRELNLFSRWQRIKLMIRRVVFFPLGMAFFFNIPILRLAYDRLNNIAPVIDYSFDKQEFQINDKQMRHPALFIRGKQVTRKWLGF